MTPIRKNVMMAAAIASSAFAFAAFASPAAAQAGPIVPQGQVCLSYAEGGTDCSFSTYSQCEATASGIDAECYGPTTNDYANDRRTTGAWHGFRHE